LGTVRADEPPEFAPITPEELVPVQAAMGDGLQVLLAGPRGPQESPRQAVVVFDRPMVPLASLDDPAASVPLTCNTPGKARWAGTSTAVFIPDDSRFPMSSTFECSVAAGSAANDGTALESGFSWSFETRPPELRRSWPRDGADQVDPNEPLILVFDQAVKPQQVADLIQLRGPSGDVSVKLGELPEDPEIRIPEETARVVVLSAELQRDTDYTLNIPVGVAGAVGDLSSTTAESTQFSTYPPPGISGMEPMGANVSPFTAIRLDLETVTEAADLGAKISISPEPPGGWDPAEAYAWRQWSYGVRLEPLTTYTVRVEPGATDTHGQTYDMEPLEWSFTTGHLPSMVDAAQGFRIYPGNNPTELPVRSRNIQDLYVALTPVDAGWLRRSGTDYDTFRMNTRASETAPVALFEGRADDDAVHVDTIDLGPLLEQGHNAVLVETWSPQQVDYRGRIRYTKAVLQVTDLAATVKLDQDGLRVWVTRLSDGQPVKDAEVDVLGVGGPIDVVKTDADGLALIDRELPEAWDAWNNPIWVDVQHGDDQVLVSTSDPHRLTVWDFGISSSYPDEAKSMRFDAFTDRGVYKPGDVAHVAFTARELTPTGLATPKNQAVAYSCEGPRGAELMEGELLLDEHGAGAFDLQLPEDMALGLADCRVETVDADVNGSVWVEVPVYAYRAPTFRVDVAAPEDAIAGDTVSATGHGRYLFGAAMGGASAEWTARAVEVTPTIEGFEDYVFSGDESQAWWDWSMPSSELLADGEGTLDGDGALPFELEVAPSEEPRTLDVELEVQVTDPARQVIVNRAHVRVHPAAFYVGLRATTGIAKAGEPAAVHLVSVFPDGEVATGVPVDVEIVRRQWDVVRQKGMDGRWTWVSTVDDQPVDTQTVSTKAQPAKVTWTPESGGYYVVKATARDEAGRTTQGEMGVYVAGAGASWARSDANVVELVPDKRQYSPGDTAHILVKSPKPGLKALVTVEREVVMDQWVVDLPDQAGTIDVKLGDEAAPNLFVSVLLVEGAPPADSPDAGMPAHYLGYTELDVSAESNRLDVAVSTDKQTYQPGENVTVTVDVERQGKPAKNAHVVLYAVDYGVLSLTAYETPEHFDRFYADRDLHVWTADARTRMLDRAALLAKGAPAGGGGGDGGPSVRNRFQTTPLWKPNLETNGQGKVEVEFTLPDDLTTFQIMAVVTHGDDGFGSAENDLQVSRPLLANASLPRVLRTGDLALAGVVVHNNTEQDLIVDVVGEAVGVKLEGSPQTVSIPAQGAIEVPFRLTNGVVGDATFTFDVQANDLRDTVEVSIPVIEPQPTETVATAGNSNETIEEQIKVPEGATPGVGGLTVSVSPTVLVGADESLSYVLDYPHGCLEQTSSRLLANVLAKEIGDAANLQVPHTILDQDIKKLLARMELFEHSSGGYTMWPGSSTPSVLATAYALEVRVAAGEPVDPDAVAFLRRFLDGDYRPMWWSEESIRSAEARVALTLARVGMGDAGLNSRLYADRDKMTLAARAELLETIQRTTGTDSRTLEILRELEGHMVVDGTRAVLARSSGSKGQALWEGDLAPSAALLRALTLAYPEHPLVPRLAQGLVQGRSRGRWTNTFTTLRSLQALQAYTSVYEDGYAVQALVSQDGDQVLKAKFDRPWAQQVTIPLGDLGSGPLVIEPSGRVYYEARLSYGLTNAPPRDEGFTVKRTMELIEGSGEEGIVTPGALVRITLQVTTPIDRYDVAVVDPLPAGLETVNSFFATVGGGMDDDADTGGGYGYWFDTGMEPEQVQWSDWIFTHRELRDDATVLFADWMPAGVHTVRYVARATTPGDYAHPAASAEEMYRPEVFGRTEIGRFVVGTPPVATK
jgi:uncharacterized protein YfaS (alpha-2-macroglobulin family)